MLNLVVGLSKINLKGVTDGFVVPGSSSDYYSYGVCLSGFPPESPVSSNRSLMRTNE